MPLTHLKHAAPHGTTLEQPLAVRTDERHRMAIARAVVHFYRRPQVNRKDVDVVPTVYRPYEGKRLDPISHGSLG